jgi:carbon storage regulator CsrA
MLILSMKIGEPVFITIPENCPAGTQIRVTYLGNNQGHTRVGFEAPKSIAIDRQTIHFRKMKDRSDE